MKIGFLCEGKTEVKFVRSNKFQNCLRRIGIEAIEPVLDAKGGGNLLPENSKEFLETLWSNGAQKIVVLTDLDEDACITSTKQRIGASENKVVIVAIKTIESWFLADSETLSFLLKQHFEFDYPEREDIPFVTIRNTFLDKQKRELEIRIF